MTDHFANNPVIQRLRTEREQVVASNRAKAALIWAGFTPNERTAVRFGMFPAQSMEGLKQAGYDEHEVCCALLDCAAKDGGVRA